MPVFETMEIPSKERNRLFPPVFLSSSSAVSETSEFVGEVGVSLIRWTTVLPAWSPLMFIFRLTPCCVEFEFITGTHFSWRLRVLVPPLPLITIDIAGEDLVIKLLRPRICWLVVVDSNRFDLVATRVSCDCVPFFFCKSVLRTLLLSQITPKVVGCLVVVEIFFDAVGTVTTSTSSSEKKNSRIKLAPYDFLKFSILVAVTLIKLIIQKRNFPCFLQ